MPLLINKSKNLYSFDLFDTLISRPLKQPAYLFDIIEQTTRVSYRIPFAEKFGFRFWRTQAERLARILSKHEDVKIKNIYRILGWIILRPASVLRHELRIEMAVIRPISENVAILHALVAEGKKCCIITDVYLPLWFIKALIRKHIKFDIDVFVSSEYGLTKATGNLFQVVSTHYGVKYGNALHVGDNPHSDIAIPNRLGMVAVKVPERSIHDSSSGLFEYFSPRQPFENIFSKIGYNIVGPICMSFAMFINSDIERRRIEKIFFGARDGYLIREAFDLLYPEKSSAYLRLSRSALYVPAFAFHKNYDRFFEGPVTVEEFFGRIGMQAPEHLRNLDPVKHRSIFERELKSMDFDQHADNESKVLVEYLRSHGFAGKVAFVDLGWRGTLQDSLQAILRNSCEIQGYYFGTIVGGVDKHGYFFENCKPSKRFALIFQAIPIFEFLFTEPVTSLKRIVKSGEQVSFDYLNDESEMQLSTRKQIADGCRRFFLDFSFIAKNLNGSDADRKSQIETLLMKFLYDPSEELVKAFEGIKHSEGFGGSKNFNVISKGPFSLSAYRNAYWRAAYVSSQKGIYGILARLIHGVAHSSLSLLLIHKSPNFRRLIDRITQQ